MASLSHYNSRRMPHSWGGYQNPKEAKIGMRVKSTFRRIATDGESKIIHYGTKFVPVV